MLYLICFLKNASLVNYLLLLCKTDKVGDAQNRGMGKIMFTAGQFAQCPALNETPGKFSYQLPMTF